jgi:cyanophycinase
MGTKNTRAVIAIGGHEDKIGPKVILREVARRIGTGKLVITTVASHQPSGLFEEYEQVFRSLGVSHVFKLEIESRLDAASDRSVRILDGATGLFFTGGDQLRITSQIGDTPVFRRVHDIYAEGGTIAGTSAGASVMCETMLVSGNDEESHKVGDSLKMAPGLGLVADLVIDQHFAERGRMGRLLGAIAQNPKNIGVGIDEQTAIVIEGGKRFYVLGDGAVYVIDGTGVTHSNIAEESADDPLSMYDVKLHLLSRGDGFDLAERRPKQVSRQTELKLVEVEEKKQSA